MKLAIGLPVIDQRVYTDFFTTFTVMRKPAFTLLLPQLESIGRIDAIRNNLVRQAIENECSHLLFMDTDQTYQIDTINRLIMHNKPIVSGVVHKRYPQFEACVMRGELNDYIHPPDKEIYSGRLIEIDACGAGCLLVDLNVFKEIEPPFFKIDVGENGKPIGEDIYFCNKAKNAGFSIFADTYIQCGHLTVMEVNESFYRLHKAAKGIEWATEPKTINKGV